MSTIISAKTLFEPKLCFSPLTATAVGPAGPPSSLTVSPYSGPSTALVISAAGLVTAEQLQWVQLGLSVPAGTTINGVRVCYQVIGTPGTHITQVRLTEMTTPNVAVVRWDDAVTLGSTTPVCYTSRQAAFVTAGTITLMLRIAIAKAHDQILLGELALVN